MNNDESNINIDKLSVGKSPQYYAKLENTIKVFSEQLQLQKMQTQKLKNF